MLAKFFFHLGLVFIVFTLGFRSPALSSTLFENAVLEKQRTIPHELRVGFAKASINPTITDVFEDLNQNARFDEGEPFTDGNGNQVFDGIWLAGFHGNRPAQGIQDDIFAVAMVIQQGSQKIAIVSLDAIGFMREEVLDVKKMLPNSLGISDVIIHSTHNHEVPDTQGLWGPSFTKSGVNLDHQKFVKHQIVDSIINAEKNLTLSDMYSTNIDEENNFFGIVDTRSPIIRDRGIRSVIFTHAGSLSIIGTVINFANHSETMWSQNLKITADWPGVVRQAIENGRKFTDIESSAGLGGTCLVLNGNIGGLLTTLPETPVYSHDTNQWITGATFEKVRAQGYGIARSVENAWIDGNFVKSDNNVLKYEKRVFDLPINNSKFILAKKLGIIRRDIFGQSPFLTKTEVSLLKLGDWQMLNIPGELYPEIAIGGVESPKYGDFPGPILETKPLRSMMSGKTNFIVNLVNDSIGYIIPYTQWDSKSPFAYGETSAPYGEENSMGPQTAPVIYKQAVSLMPNSGFSIKQRK